MLKKLTDWDKQLFLNVSRWSHPKFLVQLFIIVDSFSNAGIVLLGLSLGLIFFGSESWRKIGVLAIVIAFLSFLVEGFFLKSFLFKRPRPFEEIKDVRVYGWKPKTRSFPSGQVTGVFSLTIFFSLFFQSPLFLWLGVLFGLLTAFGRVYLGAHYPLDVVAGAILGSLLGWWWYLLLLPVK